MKYVLPIITIMAVLLYVMTVKFIAPWIAHAEIIDSVEVSCASCELEVDKVAFELFSPLQATLSGVKVKVGYDGGSEAIFRIDKIEFDLSYSKSSRRKIVVDFVRIVQPVVTFADGDAVSKKSNRKGEPGPDVIVEKVEIQNGEFTYIRETKGTSAVLHLHEINGELGPLDSSREEPAKAHLKTRLEKSGSVEIDILARLKGPTRVDVSVYIRDQNLADTNPFFKPNAGVTLTGIMEKASGRVRVRDQTAKASVWAVYHGLSLELSPMHDRSPIVAFFTNLGAELAMTDDTTDLDKKNQTQVVEVHREKGERIIGYVLRSLKEAAIKVAREAPKKK